MTQEDQPARRRELSREEKQINRLMGFAAERGFTVLFSHFYRTKKNKMKKEKTEPITRILGTTTCLILGKNKEVLSRGVASSYAKDRPTKVLGRLWALKRAYGAAVSESKSAAARLWVHYTMPGFDYVPVFSRREEAVGLLTAVEANNVKALREWTGQKKEKVA
jgi:hypothetical protein